jgi:hypothetical protein
MDIDITDLSSSEIIQVLYNYPRGKLGIKYERIFWITQFSQDPKARAAANLDPRQQPKGEGEIGQRFERMADTLGRLVC